MKINLKKNKLKFYDFYEKHYRVNLVYHPWSQAEKNFLEVKTKTASKDDCSLS